MAQHLLQGLKEIAAHIGLQEQHSDSRRVLRSWITKEGMPVKRLAGRWYADAQEVEEWWASRTGGRRAG